MNIVFSQHVNCNPRLGYRRPGYRQVTKTSLRGFSNPSEVRSANHPFDTCAWMLREEPTENYTVCSLDGEFIATINTAQRNRLIGCTDEGRAPRQDDAGKLIYNTRLIQVHRKKTNLYYSLVDASVIRAEVRRELTNTVPIAEDNRTIRKEPFSSNTGSGWLYSHNMPHCFAYGPEALSTEEMRPVGIHLVPTRQIAAGPDSNRIAMPHRSNVIPFPTPKPV